MTAEEYGKLVEQIINDAEQRFGAEVAIRQRGILQRMGSLISQLKVDSNGNIKRTAENIKISRRINRAVNQELLTESYKSTVRQYLGNFKDLENTSVLYYSTFEGFKPSNIHFSQLKVNAIASAQEALLGAGISANFKKPIQNILDRNILTGASFNDLVKETRDFIIGVEGAQGALQRYASQITADSLHIYNGMYNDSLAEDLDLSWYRYSGGVIAGTRPFCQQRSRKFYHKDEIRGWASLDWAGKIKGTTASSIFYYVGGYRCRHILVPVSEAVVPKAVLLKNQA